MGSWIAAPPDAEASLEWYVEVDIVSAIIIKLELIIK